MVVATLHVQVTITPIIFMSCKNAISYFEDKFIVILWKKEKIKLFQVIDYWSKRVDMSPNYSIPLHSQDLTIHNNYMQIKHTNDNNNSSLYVHISISDRVNRLSIIIKNGYSINIITIYFILYLCIDI